VPPFVVYSWHIKYYYLISIPTPPVHFRVPGMSSEVLARNHRVRTATSHLLTVPPTQYSDSAVLQNELTSASYPRPGRLHTILLAPYVLVSIYVHLGCVVLCPFPILLSPTLHLSFSTALFVQLSHRAELGASRCACDALKSTAATGLHLGDTAHR
jgi:hypothetical protein